MYYCIAIKKNGVKCTYKAKYGNLCGVHFNSNANKQQASVQTSKQKTIKKFEETVAKNIDKKIAEFVKKVQRTTRRNTN